MQVSWCVQVQIRADATLLESFCFQTMQRLKLFTTLLCLGFQLIIFSVPRSLQIVPSFKIEEW